MPELRKTVADALAGFRADEQSAHSVAVQKATYLACVLQVRAVELQTPQERKQQAELDRMIQNPRDKATLTQLTDQAFRSQTAQRSADQLVHILDVQGIPRFFSPFERTLLKGFQSFGNYLPGVAVPLVKDRMRRETANVILPADAEMLAKHLQARRDEGVRMNVNYLGEALLGEQEAENRLRSYLQALQLPDIEVLSVKISTIYSQISAIAREHTIAVLCDRVELLYRAAAKGRFVRADGTEVPKFVYMDMEEYRDMDITAEVFMQTLSRPGLEDVTAGIVLQAYIPDSYRTQRQLNAWARERVTGGGAPVTLRIVKGANMEMERVEASLRDWPQAPFKTKLETDANYKRMLHEGMQPENRAAVRLGVASHNLFDLSYALVLAVENDALDQIQFEMLEGMANHQRRALFELSQNMLLYSPACNREDFIHAIGYLVRRLDENTGPENFLRHAFKIHVDSDEWRQLETGFLRSFDALDKLSDAPRRTQDRHATPSSTLDEDVDWQAFTNEPDTDFSLAQNVEWAQQVIANWQDRCDEKAVEIPLEIAGQELEARDIRDCLDPSRPGVVVGRYRQATEGDVELAVAAAREDEDGWRTACVDQRLAVLLRVAQEIRQARGDLMGAALADAGKTLLESDPEVSEAVDFVEFYSRAARYFSSIDTLQAAPKGVVAVVSPWNFPIAIPCGGIAAALAAGNAVILKPASDSVLIAHELCKCFWRGGVSKNTLQLLPCSGATAGARLVAHPDVDVVILTGGTQTAQNMLAAKPGLHLLAETGGKNATIVTAMSDRDQTIKNVLHSAFSHSGQKCSATSLLILEDEVYDDPRFKESLCDAVQSLQVGSAWDVKNKMGPLIRPPSGDLERGLKELEPGESWAVLPKHLEDNPHLYSPGVKWGVQPGSYTHMTEFFGPVLGVMRAKNLHEAIDLVNQTGFGLTSGLESLDDREQELWTDAIRAGNLYINRPTTGAIVLRQPFGGMGKSAFGPGIKAGGPNYVAQLMDFADHQVAVASSRRPSAESESHEVADEQLAGLRRALMRAAENPHPGALPEGERARVVAAIESYSQNMQTEFGTSHDHFRLLGQDNLRRYAPVRELRVRVHPDDSPFEIFARVCAAKTVGCRTTVSVPHMFESAVIDLFDQLTEPWAAAVEFVEESDEELAQIIRTAHTERIRYAAANRVPDDVRRAAAETGLYVADARVLAEGRVELLWYVREQSVCSDYHRYGNLGARADEPRREPT